MGFFRCARKIDTSFWCFNTSSISLLPLGLCTHYLCYLCCFWMFWFWEILPSLCKPPSFFCNRQLGPFSYSAFCWIWSPASHVPEHLGRTFPPQSSHLRYSGLVSSLGSSPDPSFLVVAAVSWSPPCLPGFLSAPDAVFSETLSQILWSCDIRPSPAFPLYAADLQSVLSGDWSVGPFFESNPHWSPKRWEEIIWTFISFAPNLEVFPPPILTT